MESTNLRPTFLTVLCVLTFIYSGFEIYNAVTSYTSAEMAVGVAKDAMDEAQDQIEAEDVPDFVGKLLGSVSEGLTVENMRNSAMASGIGNILTLLGAILMWGLNKKGYFTYIAGNIVLVLAPLFIYEGFVGAAGSSGAAFIAILFGVLYGLNLKHMS
jgi:membrane associated rhomboid family serine protease